jgi:hypothetical protein
MLYSDKFCFFSLVRFAQCGYYLSERRNTMAKTREQESGEPVADANKVIKTRSPSSPSFGLEEAIQRTGDAYNNMHDHFVGLDALAELWDTNLKSSAFQQAISTLKQFGLLEDTGRGADRQIKITELAKDILVRDENSSERTSFIKTAALTPAIHAELWQKYGGNLPVSDSAIRVYLLRERTGTKFNKDHVDSFIGQFRATIAFANLTSSDTIPSPNGEGEKPQSSSGFPAWGFQFGPKATPPEQPPVTKPQTSVAPQPIPNVPTVASGVRDIPISLPSLEIAVVRAPLSMSEEDYNYLMEALTRMKKKLVQNPQ